MSFLLALLLAVGLLGLPHESPPGLRFGWPLLPARVTRPFLAPPEPWLPGHRGADLAGQPGDPVRAAAAGTVVYAAVLAGRGVVSVAHAGGLRSTYEPVDPAVTAGSTVTGGQLLGRLDPGHPGCPVAACLHWGVRRNDLYLDPLILLGIGRVRLLPLPVVQQAG
ncbi:peptidase [Actinoplanes sp. SE50]|uniref:M23 family metallopeptidase n=1 Tax=unclassified Actinoplanes TaxID=2626549 RepID=UPI00023EDE33|nr:MULTISPECIES: M23 family metallopeptidase [unclassified Actinoplanes]AEV88151.1 uncharacterized protein ACPL_7271 [Actinoplanes sp. SE50/110]ATO86556.1 peptidase [Actinoplanes sp. SE50]SLM03973.1 peptidase [Actinoplanes sp. SE50/110]